MAEQSHTPGPWEYYPASNYAGFSVAPLGTLPTLAAVERPRGNPQTLNVTAFNFPGETEANARLIAAAPELLEALIEMEREKSEYMTRNNLGDPAKEHTNKMARAAIAKATGGSV